MDIRSDDPELGLRQSRTFQQVREQLAAYQARFGQLEPEEAAEAEPSREPDIVARAQATILAELARSLSLDELARLVGTNRYSLNQQFRVRLGVSVHACRREQRLLRASQPVERKTLAGVARRR